MKEVLYKEFNIRLPDQWFHVHDRETLRNFAHNSINNWIDEQLRGIRKADGNKCN